VLVERFENALFEIHSELRERFAELEVVPRIADITDRARMKRVFEEARPDVLLHAAAHKHVPMMECNPGEAIKNNVIGTRTIVAPFPSLCASSTFDLAQPPPCSRRQSSVPSVRHGAHIALFRTRPA